MTPIRPEPVPAIRAQALAKCYQIYAQPSDRLRQMVLGRLSGHRRRFYREFWALSETSFEVARGEVLGLVGRNGAGKSTLLQLVCGTLTPSTGTIAVNGRIAALLELGAGFNPEFSGRENVFLAASILGLGFEETRARFESIVEFSGIRDFIDQPVKTYSSGMYVRLAFAVATSVDPDILVVDEALSVGDGEFARKSFDRIMALKRGGTTILFCSHSLYQVEAFCDRVLWLERGSPMMLGAPQDVVRRYGDFLAGLQAPPAETPAHAASPTASEAPVTPVPGYARFARLEAALDGAAGTQLRARSGECSLAVRLQFDSDPLLPPPVVGVTLDYGTLLSVTCAVSRTDGLRVDRDAAGRGEVLLTFPRLALRKGQYRIGAYLGCENALHLYDSAPEFAALTVEDALPEPGLVNLPHAWRSSPGHAQDPIAAAAAAGNRRRAVLADGRTLWVAASDSLHLAAGAAFEPAETALCAALLRPGQRALDIGANVGYYTTLFAECVGAAGRVDAIEPDPENFALLDANTREAQAAGQVRLHALALSDASGSARLYRSRENTGMHRLYDSVCCDAGAIEVRSLRGDELDLAPLDLIKIDVEGFEPMALRGLAATIAHSPHVRILCEYSPLAMLEAGADPRGWLQWMKEQGFRALGFDGEQWSVAACADLEAQAMLLARIDIARLRSELTHADQPTIDAAVAAAAAAAGYARPVVENLLFARIADLPSLLRVEAP